MMKSGHHKAKSVTFEQDLDLKKDDSNKKPQQEFDAKQYITPGSEQREVEVWKEVFDLFDTDGTGTLTPMNIRNAMLTLGYNPERKIIYQMVSDVDTDESGGVEFDEFVKLMAGKPCEKDDDAEIEEVFYNYDVDKKGYITKEDMLRTAKELKEELNEDEVDVIFSEVDPQGEGKITLKAWMKFMKRQTYNTINNVNRL